MHRLRPLLAAAALAALLAACGGAPTPPAAQPFVVEGTVLDMTGVPVPVNVSLLAALPSALGADVGAAAVNEFPNGTAELASAVLTADGAFRLEFPSGDQIPSTFFADATLFLDSPLEDVTCSATSASTARVLRVYFNEALALPYLWLGPMSDLALGFGVLLYGDEVPATFPSPDFATHVWTYAQGPVAVTGSCTFDDGIDPPRVVATWDLELEPGWNRLRLAYAAAEQRTTIDTGAIAGARWRAFLP